MQTLSNNEDYMNAIQSLKKKQRKQKTAKGTTPYRYIIATNQNMQQFIRNTKLFEEEQIAKEEELKQLEQEKLEQEQNELQEDQNNLEEKIEEKPDTESEQSSESEVINEENNN
jgi:hypothetical protein